MVPETSRNTGGEATGAWAGRPVEGESRPGPRPDPRAGGDPAVDAKVLMIPGPCTLPGGVRARARTPGPFDHARAARFQASIAITLPPPAARSASTLPIRQENLNPWPLHGLATMTSG